MGVIHHFSPQEARWKWDGVERKTYPSGEAPSDPKGVSLQWLVGKNEGAPFFAIRYFEVDPGGQTILDQHVHDHGVFILRGTGKVRLGDKEYEIRFGDVIYISSNEIHQLINDGQEILAFLCVIPNKDHLKRLLS